MVDTLTSIFKKLAIELLIICSLVLVFNNYLQFDSKEIKADAIGYYEYLPSIFIHNDFVRLNQPIKDFPEKYERINKHAFYVDFDGYKVDKYPVGTALLESPFFLAALPFASLNKNFEDGYQQPFHTAVVVSSFFYLFLSLLLLKQVLLTYKVNRLVVFLIQLFMVYSTSVLNYTYNDAGYSHIYSLFAVLLFLYATRKFSLSKNANEFYLMAISFGLIVLLRNINLLILLAIPFIVGSYQELSSSAQYLVRRWQLFIKGLLISVAMVFIQMLMWYLQTGSWIVYSYQGEGFNFHDPKVFNFLWSYSGGLFVFAPIFLLSLLGAFRYLLRKEYYLFLTWSGFFVVIIYVLSSWWTWKYGMSFGMRAMIEFYPILFIPVAVFLSQESWKITIPIAIIGLLTIPVSVIQTYQYKEYILHWTVMSKSDYWKVFLETDPQFKGLLWKVQEVEDKNLKSEFKLGDFKIAEGQWKEIKSFNQSDIPYLPNLTCVEVLIDDEFASENNSKIIVYIKQGEEVLFWEDKYLLHFEEQGINRLHTGKGNFRFSPVGKKDSAAVSIALFANSSTKEFRNVNVRFYTD